LAKLVSCTGTVAKTNIFEVYSWIYPLPLMYSLYSCETAVINSLLYRQLANFLTGKVEGIKGEGQLILAMMTSFVKAGGDHTIYGILLSPARVS